jgi:2-dehydro-3-deoxygluconokinase
MPRVVAFGECMVEFSPLPEPGTYRIGFAGDTLNTVWYLRRRLPPEWTIDYCTAVGTDGISQRMITFFEEAGIGTRHIQRRNDRTVGLYLIESRNGERSFSYWRGQSAARTLAEDSVFLFAAIDGARLAYFSGITLAILPQPGRARLFEALARCRKAGGIVAFDPNLRPKLWQSSGEMKAAIEIAAGHADILLPSFADEAEWFGDADPHATAHRYAACGAREVVVKDGGRDVVALSEGESLRCPVAPVANVVDTTAAGDSFNAGYLAARITGANIADAVARGAQIAARVVAARGALVPEAATD